MAERQGSLGAKAAKGAAWSGASSIILRLGSLTVGIILARLLTPEQFGVYAVALTVQSILMTIADLGLSADLVRSKEPEKIAPTVATLGLVSSSLVTAITFFGSSQLAELLGSPEAAPAIAVLAFTLLLAGVSLVPYSMMLRRFQQRELFLIGVVDFVVSTTVTLALVAAGYGVMALAIGRVAAQIVASTLQFLYARVRPQFGIDRAVVSPVLSFGVPIATANLLAWALINIDNIVLARIAGATALGYYVIAFNVSSWPMSALSQSVRAISLPYFSRTDNSAEGLSRIVAVGWAVALPAGTALAVLSGPVIGVLYGEKWLPSAPVLAALGVFGSLRVIFDILTAFLYAKGRSKPVLWIQVLWIVTLSAGMVAATHWFGIVGAGWVHVLVAVLIVLPAYLLALRTSGVSVTRVLRRSWWPTLATIPAGAAAWVICLYVGNPVAQLLLGGCGAVAVYVAIMWPWGVREWRAVRPVDGDVAIVPSTGEAE
jgi:O-antigen/teichoic acid export membrane protein